jgi:hypothetical protein
MSKTTLLLPVLLTVVAGASARPPAGVSGRVVADGVLELKAEVERLQRHVDLAPSAEEISEACAALFEARARLAEAEGKPAVAAAEWRKVLAHRVDEETRIERLLKQGKLCIGIAPAMLQGPVADARCHLAEVERNRAVLAAELPKVIAYRQAQLEQLKTLRDHRAYPAEETSEERAMRDALRKARLLLDAVKAR